MRRHLTGAGETGGSVLSRNRVIERALRYLMLLLGLSLMSLGIAF